MMSKPGRPVHGCPQFLETNTVVVTVRYSYPDDLNLSINPENVKRPAHRILHVPAVLVVLVLQVAIEELHNTIHRLIRFRSVRAKLDPRIGVVAISAQVTERIIDLRGNHQSIPSMVSAIITDNADDRPLDRWQRITQRNALSRTITRSIGSVIIIIRSNLDHDRSTSQRVASIGAKRRIRNRTVIVCVVWQ